MQISRYVVNGPKSNNKIVVGIVCIHKPSHHFLQTFSPLCMFNIVFHVSSLYRNQLSFVLSAMAEQRMR